MAAVSDVLRNINNEIINPIIVLLFGLSLVLFLWGGFKFIRDADSEDGRTIGKSSLIWGIVGMVIMASVYGILRLVTASFGVVLPTY